MLSLVAKLTKLFWWYLGVSCRLWCGGGFIWLCLRAAAGGGREAAKETLKFLLFEPTVLSQNGHDKTEHTLTAQNERTHFSSMGDTVHAHAPRYRTGLSAFTRQGGKCRNCTGIGIYLKRHGCARAYSRTVLPRTQAREAKHCCAQARVRLLAHYRAGRWDQNFHEPAVVAWRGRKV